MIRYGNRFYQDGLKKYECIWCRKEFIIGTESSRDIELVCPYCGLGNPNLISYTDNERLEELELGCLGIYFDTGEEIK